MTIIQTQILLTHRYQPPKYARWFSSRSIISWELLKNAYSCNVRENEKEKKILDPSLYLDPHQKLMNGVYSGPTPILWKSVWYFLCNPADKPANKRTDRGENINSLAEVKMRNFGSGHWSSSQMALCWHSLPGKLEGREALPPETQGLGQANTKRPLDYQFIYQYWFLKESFRNGSHWVTTIQSVSHLSL